MDIKIDKIKGLMKDPQIRKYSIGGGLLFIGIIYLLFIVIPQFVGLTKTLGQVKDSREKIKVTEDRINRLDEIKARSKKLREELQECSKRFSAQKEITILVEAFASIARKSDVKILSITPQKLKAVEGREACSKYYREMPVKITAKSGYHELGEFISSLEGGDRVIIINDLQIQYETGTPRLHNVNIMVKTYVAVEDESPKKDEKKE